MLFAIRILADQRANKHPEYKSFSLDASSVLDSRRCAYADRFQTISTFRGRFDETESFRFAYGGAPLRRCFVGDLILESLFACASAQSTRKIRRVETSFRHVLSQKREQKCVRLSNNRRHRILISVF